MIPAVFLKRVSGKLFSCRRARKEPIRTTSTGPPQRTRTTATTLYAKNNWDKDNTNRVRAVCVPFQMFSLKG